MADIRIKKVYFGGRSFGSAVFDFLNVLFLILAAVTFTYPFWITLLTSFASERESMLLGFHLWISEWQLNAYKFLFSEYGSVGTAYINSIVRTVAGTFLIVVFTLLAAYPLSKKNLPGRTFITIYFLITMFFGGGLVPTYLWIRKIGLLNNRLVLILPLLANAFYIIIMRNFLMTIDSAYEEAALVDGAGYFHILFRIIVPLSKPVIATISLWAAVAHWNAWFDCLIYINDSSKEVLQIFLRRILTLYHSSELQDDMQAFADQTMLDIPTNAVQAAVTIVTIGPIIFVYPFIQKYFIKGIFIGSLKG
jgi:putative aldouronate transport system permease protein